ncbi:MAG: HAD-IA family hydrolase [Armatimonadetes bacterium]|nr:HAD-IA family hydrolase [Armatimonadota bacterium]
MIRLVTFDASGTLVDHDWDPAGLIYNAATALGVQVPETKATNAYERIHTRRRASLEEVEKRGDPSEIRAFWQGEVAEWLQAVGGDPSLSRDIYETCRRKTFSTSNRIWRVFPDVEGALSALRARGLRLGVISNWDSSLHEILRNLRIYEHFDFVVASLEFGVEKPAAGIFLEALRRGDAQASETLHVGDHLEDDVRGAEAAGMRALHLDRSRPPDRAAGRIADLAEVAEAVAACG